MNYPVRRRCDGRSRMSVLALVAAVGCAVVVALTDVGRLVGNGVPGGPEPSPSSDGRVSVKRAAGSSFTLLQMNLCLSGMAGCYGRAAYPAVVREAVARIREVRPDAVTVNEACRRDARTLARRTGYHVRFVRVIYAGDRLPCIDPGGRGLFGDAVLSRARITTFASRAFRAQAGFEERRWLCVTTRLDQDVCGAHLGTRRTSAAATANDAQCAELGALLGRRATARTVVFGGDVNRLDSCAPDGFWTRTDRHAGQSPGVQHIYGGGALRSPRGEVLPAAHSDHDALLVRATVQPR